MTNSFLETILSNTSKEEHYSTEQYASEKNNVNTSMNNVEVSYVINSATYRVSTDKTREKEKVMNANHKLRMAGL